MEKVEHFIDKGRVELIFINDLGEMFVFSSKDESLYEEPNELKPRSILDQKTSKQFSLAFELLYFTLQKGEVNLVSEFFFDFFLEKELGIGHSGHKRHHFQKIHPANRRMHTFGLD